MIFIIYNLFWLIYDGNWYWYFWKFKFEFSKITTAQWDFVHGHLWSSFQNLIFTNPMLTIFILIVFIRNEMHNINAYNIHDELPKYSLFLMVKLRCLAPSGHLQWWLMAYLSWKAIIYKRRLLLWRTSRAHALRLNLR